MDVLDATDQLAAAVDALGGADPGQLADAETIQTLHRQLERLSAVTTRAAATFDAGGTWEADGARSAAAWLSVRCHLPVSSARRRSSWARPCATCQR